MIFYTSIATNYLPKARVLARSVKTHHPDARFVLLLVDKKPPGHDWSKEPFDDVLTVQELDIANWKGWLFGFRIVEACTAVKPFALMKLLEKYDAPCIYLDPDIVVFAALAPVTDALKTHSVVFTPHINKPEQGKEAIEDNEINSLRHGLYNLGFVAVKNDNTGKAYAKWWAERCYDWCRDDIPNGLFTDQRWNDLVPIFFDNVAILKNPGLNVATWNYAQRHIEGGFDSSFTVDGEPLYFHHFSGYDNGAHLVMRNKYGATMPATIALSEWYEEQTLRADNDDISKTIWAYGAFDNGVPITNDIRQIYRTRQDVVTENPDPYAALGAPGFYHWLHHEHLLERMKFPNTSVLFVTYNSKDVIGDAILSLNKLPYLGEDDVHSVTQHYFLKEIIVVDNASTDGTCDYVREHFPHVRVIRNDKNIGFGRACNVGLRSIDTEFVLLMNPDARLRKNTLVDLMHAAGTYPDAALLAPQLFDALGHMYFNFRQNVFDFEKNPTALSQADGDTCVEFITGALWLGRMAALRHIGFFDDTIFMYCEDDDICLRLKMMRYPMMIIAGASAVHFGGMSSPKGGRMEFFKQRHMMYSRLFIEAKYHHGEIHSGWLWSTVKSYILRAGYHTLKRHKIQAALYLGRLKGVWDYFRFRKTKKPYY
jgi:GT2 family glycosyltransferase